MIKRVILGLLEQYWKLKTDIYYKLYGSYGISHCIEIMPFPFIIKTLKRYGAIIGKNCTIERGLYIHRPSNNEPFEKLRIGDNVYIGHNALIDITSNVTIENDTAIGSHVKIWTHTGDWTFDRSDEKEERNFVSIGRSVIIYSGAIISQGIKIGDYARVGAGSVVIKDIPEKVFAAGQPAYLIRERKI